MRDDLLARREHERPPLLTGQLVLEARRVREQLSRRSERQRLVEVDGYDAQDDAAMVSDAEATYLERVLGIAS